MTNRQIAAQIEPGAVHGGVAAEVVPLPSGLPEFDRLLEEQDVSLLLFLDRVTDPRNVGAILRSASVFGAAAVLVPGRGAPRESGALAKAASGALDRIPYLRIGNLSGSLARLDAQGWRIVGLSESAAKDIERVSAACRSAPLALVLGAEGAGLRRLTRERCHELARIPARTGEPSLNVSAAAAVALYAFATCRRRDRKPA